VQGKVNVDAGNTAEGYIQSLFSFFLVSTFLRPLNFQRMSQGMKLKGKQTCSEVESKVGSMMNY